MSSGSIKIKSIIMDNNTATCKLSDGTKYVLPLSSVHEHRLVEGIILTESQLDILSNESEKQCCFNQVKKYLAIREHSSGELRLKLKKKLFSETVISESIKHFESAGLVDNEQYALSLGKRLLENKPCGRSYMTAYLLNKMIGQQIVRNVVDMVFSQVDYAVLAERALEKKWHMFADLELEDARNKSYNYLARRGFPYKTAKTVFEKIYNLKKEDLNHQNQ